MTLTKRRSLDITSVDRGGCMARFREGLYSVQLESCVITLTLVSVLAITGELLINLHIVQVPENNGYRGGRNGGGAFVNTSQIDVNSTGSLTNQGASDSTSTEPLETAHLVFHYISLAIASIFLLEIMLKILVKGKSFFLKIFQVADALIVLGTFALEVVFTVEEEELPFLEAATYIIILRLWRVHYVCNIRAKDCKREMTKELEIWQTAKNKLEDRCRDMQTRLDKQQVQMRDLEKKIHTHTVDERQSQTQMGRKSDKDKDTTQKVPVSNGHIPKITCTEVDEENANHVIKSTNQCTADQNNVEVSPEVLVEEPNTDIPISHEHISVNCDVSDVNHAQEQPSQARGPIMRTDSESSLSCDHVEQEVVVQIEGHPVPKQQLSTTDETVNLIEEANRAMSGEFSYSNAMFEEENNHDDLPVLHEIDGVKTYRSVEGIPMTSL